jgi:dUTP pyrophosphatase
VIVALHNDHPFDIFGVKPGDRIAQAALEHVEPVTLVEASVLDSTERGTGGFGSTGVK